MINISQPFHRTSASPIDETIAITKAQMVLIDDNLMPDYYFTICQDDGYIYLYDKSATPTISTGKFTKFEGGGGGGGTGTPGISYPGTLVAANWNTTTNEQTITFTDYDEAFGGVIGIPSTATDAHKDAYGKSEISIVSQSGATVTFKAEEIPTIDLPVLIYCGSESSSGGGHEILDTSGTSMTQEDKLQFVGLDVTDDDTNEITKVGGIGLNSDSLDDIASAGLPSTIIAGSPFNYSTTEQIVGRWIDGKPLYQITIIDTVGSWSTPTPHSIGNIDKVVGIDYVLWTNLGAYSLGRGGSIDIMVNISKTEYWVSCTYDYFTSKTGYLTVRYTKTTD